MLDLVASDEHISRCESPRLAERAESGALVIV
jgi:hypothetical protein